MKWADNKKKKNGFDESGSVNRLEGSTLTNEREHTCHRRKRERRVLLELVENYFGQEKKEKIKKKKGRKEMKDTVYNLKSTTNKKKRNAERLKT